LPPGRVGCTCVTSVTPRLCYLVGDHQHLVYLNGIEKVNCLYRSYASGLMAYAQEVVAGMEQFWCPIKHARRVRGGMNVMQRLRNTVMAGPTSNSC
jgi:hypothetical protein